LLREAEATKQSIATKQVWIASSQGLLAMTAYSQEQPSSARIESPFNLRKGGVFMGRYLLLWLIGVPLPILVLIYAFGGLH
jgi:hypothetical protein